MKTSVIHILALLSSTSAYIANNEFSPNPNANSGRLARSKLVARQNATASDACATGVHMIVARASTEQPGQGIIGAVATQVQSQLPGSDSEAVDYPATLSDYTTSERMGVSAMTSLIQSYVMRCPSSKIALLGYSQGAQVAGDVMCGTTEKFFNSTPALSAAYSKNVVAIIQMGDPTHVPGLAQDVGNSTKAGIFPRNNTASCPSTMSAMTQSYCDANDKFCDSGDSVVVHLSYVLLYGNQAADFIVKVAGGTNATATNGDKKAAGNRVEGGSWAWVFMGLALYMVL